MKGVRVTSLDWSFTFVAYPTDRVNKKKVFASALNGTAGALYGCPRRPLSERPMFDLRVQKLILPYGMSSIAERYYRLKTDCY